MIAKKAKLLVVVWMSFFSMLSLHGQYSQTFSPTVVLDVCLNFSSNEKVLTCGFCLSESGYNFFLLPLDLMMHIEQAHPQIVWAMEQKIRLHGASILFFKWCADCCNMVQGDMFVNHVCDEQLKKLADLGEIASKEFDQFLDTLSRESTDSKCIVKNKKKKQPSDNFYGFKECPDCYFYSNSWERVMNHWKMQHPNALFCDEELND